MQVFRPLWLALPVLLLFGCSPAAPPADSAAQAPSPPASVAAVSFPAQLQAAGVEPFWGVRVDGAALSYTTPDTLDQPRLLQGQRAQHGDVLTLRGEDSGEAFTLTISAGPCSDGMSDLAHPFHAEFVLGAQTFKGCARDLAPVAAP